MKIHTEIDVGPRRAADYMDIGDQLDAMMKGFDALQELGIELPAETVAWIAHCKEVKARHRKT
ncbi:hypothetical protein AB6809_30005 [Paraburkholderia sp. RCC_158]|uniref:hypothetical protein n=1 Tax=Paraburkholderia sp. RCC_158 TaxID=3239220 RepID=UPI003524DA02